jgi:proteasome lid subunit RPN8/RPN11
MTRSPGISEHPPEPPRRGKRLGTVHEQAHAVLLREKVLEEILEYSESDLTREVGGFLIGEVAATKQPRVEVQHFLPAGGTRSEAASLTFTHQTWSRMHREIEAQFPEKSVVGWHHTHPGLGIFLSQYDLFIHRNFFGEPWQIAMVVDPRREEFGIFQWKGDQVIDCGFVCLSEPDARTDAVGG